MTIARSLLVFLSILFMLTVPVVAANDILEGPCKDVATGESAICDDARNETDPVSGPNNVVTRVANVLAFAAGFIALVVLVVSGIQFMLSRGDPQKAASARSAIIYTVIGVVVIVFARAIVVYIAGRIQ
jgi:hypothetical protein